MMEIKHYYECPHCFDEAFILDHKPVNGEAITSKIAYKLDGEPMPAGSRIRCGTCGMALNLLMSSQVREYE